MFKALITYHSIVESSGSSEQLNLLKEQMKKFVEKYKNMKEEKETKEKTHKAEKENMLQEVADLKQEKSNLKTVRLLYTYNSCIKIVLLYI